MQASRSQEEEDLLRAAHSAVLERRQAADEERQHTWTFMARHGEVAASFHERLFYSALQAAGIDAQALAERHQAERDSAMRFLAGQKQRAMELAANVGDRHRDNFAERALRLTHISSLPPSNPLIFEQLTLPTDMQLKAQRGTISIAPQENLARTKVERLGWVSGLKWDLRGDDATVDWHFLWTPPRAGLLNVWSILSMNGWGGAYPGPGCIKGSSSWSISAELSVTQLGANGLPFKDSVQMKIAEDSFGSSEVPSFGGVILTSNRLNYDTPLSYQNQFVAAAQVPLLITVTAALYVQVNHGEAELNFMDGNFHLNVPYVFLFLT